MMNLLTLGLTKVFDLILYPFSGLAPIWGITFLSVLTAVVMLLIYRLTSNQKGIKRSKNLIKANFLEIWLFRDDPGVMLRVQRKILGANLRYMSYALVPLAVMIIPIILLLVQCELRYGKRPLRPDESTLVKVKLNENQSVANQNVDLHAPAGVKVETPPMKIPALNEVNWRIQITEPGSHELKVQIGTQQFTKRLEASERIVTLSEIRSKPSFSGAVFHPGEKALPGDGSIEWISISYPAFEVNFLGWKVHWLVPLLVLSIVFGFGMKGFFGVEV